MAKLDSSIKATVLLLKGLEVEKEEIIQSSKGKQEMNSKCSAHSYLSSFFVESRVKMLYIPVPS